MMGAFVALAGAFALLILAWVTLPLILRRPDQAPAAPYAALGVATSVLVLGGALYVALSNFDWNAPKAAADSPEAMVASLARKLEREPNNLDGWLMLGRSYSVLQQYPLAARAFQRADQLADGKNPEALTGLAESLVVQDENELDGRAGRLFERALELDPTSGKALFFTGAAALRRGDLVVARERFSRLLDLNPPENIRPILQQQIAAIDAQMKDRGAAAAANESAPAGNGSPAAAAATVRVRVSLGPRLDTKSIADVPLFVFVREANAPGPPLAAKRLRAQFPATVELGPADSMMAGRSISAGQQVEVVARLAKGGGPTAVSGDLFGTVRYHIGKDGVADLVIDQVTP